MSEMVERVARAMGDVADAHAAAEGCDDVGVLDADLLLDLAAAAIEAIHEPTEEMTRAGHIALVNDRGIAPGPFTIERIYRAMMLKARAAPAP